MNLDAILSLFSILCTIVVGLILRSQIRSQEKIIEGMRAYVSVLDIDKIKQYDEYRENTILLKAKHEADDMVRNHMTNDVMMESFARYVQRNNEDLFNYAFEKLSELPIRERERVLNDKFGVNREMLIRMFDDERTNP